MTSTKHIKKSLVAGILSMVVCCAMLIGTTFAWFTDTASTAVNKIQAGELKVALEMSTDGVNWVNAKDRTLTFMIAGSSGTDTDTDKILWEPGCTYKLPQLRVVNYGNLALKYKIVVAGAVGDTDLLNAIKFSVGEKTLDEFCAEEGKLSAGTAESPTYSAGFTISGTMDTAAGNRYQNLSIEGIAITVVATQDTVESDSTTDQYDSSAEYPDTTVNDLLMTYGNDGLRMPTGVNITSGDNGKVTVTLNDAEAFLYFTQVFDMNAACEARAIALENGTATRYPGESVHNNLNIWYRAYQAVNVVLACDVDLQNLEVTPFTECSTFNGGGHTIKNASVQGNDTCVGFFGRYSVSNVKMDKINVKATGNQCAGVISGFNSVAIKNVTVTNSNVTGGKYTGAIVGNCYVNLEECTVENCNISGQYKVGGLAGYVCREDGNKRYIRNNTLRNVTIKGENLISGKENYVIGQVVGNWNALNGGECKNNKIDNVTGATTAIGEVESGRAVDQ